MSPTPSPRTDEARRVLAALERAARQARRLAAQTGTRLVVVRDGALVLEPVRPEPDAPEASGPDDAPGL